MPVTSRTYRNSYSSARGGADVYDILACSSLPHLEWMSIRKDWSYYYSAGLYIEKEVIYDNVQYEMDISLCATLISSLCRRIEQLETTNAIEREPPPTLPVNENSRASSPNSLDGIGPTAISVNNTGLHHYHHQQQQQGATAEITAHEDEVGVSSLNSDPLL